MLEARSATAQADYDLQAAIGATEIAHGDLANALGISPTSQFQVQSIQDLPIPQELDDTVEKSIDRALSQRPDLMQQVEQLRAAGAEIKAAKTAYLPTLTFDGYGGLSHSYGQQALLPGVYSPNQETWDARLSLTWNVFDGFARENRLARAKADQKQAQAQVDTLRDQVENQVWAAYSTARTALREQKAAAALLASATRVLQRRITVLQLRRSQPDRRGLCPAYTGCGAHRRCDGADAIVDRNRRFSLSDGRPASCESALTWHTEQTNRHFAKRAKRAAIGGMVFVALQFAWRRARAPRPSIFWGRSSLRGSLCGLLGIVLTVVARLVLVRVGIEQHLSPLVWSIHA